MRYKLSLPLRARARSPSRPTTNPLSIQRAQPIKCVVSLASVTVSMSSADGDMDQTSDMDQTGMSIDQATVDEPLAQASGPQTAAIPFPTSSKRTHSLLRSTSCSLIQPSDDIPFESEDEASLPVSDGDCCPPRKRTRTSALSSSLRPPGNRFISPPPTAPPSLGLQYADGTSSGLADASCTTTLTPSTPTTSVVWATPASASSPRRKWRPAHLRMQIYVYRTLVYGLKVKYCDGDQIFVDLMDGRLAQRLRTQLREMGAPLNVLVVDPQAISQIEDDSSLANLDHADTPHFDSLGMVVDDELPLLPLHLQPSTIYSVRSYQQLVAALFLSKELRFARPHRPLSKIAWKAKLLSPRPPSKLAQCIFSES